MGSDLPGRRPRDDTAAPRAVAIFGSFRLGQYYEDILAGVMAAAHLAGGSVISVQSSAGVLPSSFERGGQDAVSRVAWDHFDAAIVILASVSVEYVARLRAAGKFVVAIGQELRGAAAAIVLDNAGGVRAAVSHLAEHGHTAIGFVAPTWQVDTPERFAAYQERMSELGLTWLPRMGAELSPELSLDQQGCLAAQLYLAGERACTALIFVTDPMALGFMREVRAAGVVIPDDLAIVGIDDVDEAAVSAPPLATVAISFERVGETAFNVALRGGRGETVQSRYLVPQRYVPRQSCGCVGDAIAHLADDARSPLDAWTTALAEAAQESAMESSIDPAAVRTLARQVADALARPVTREAVVDRATISALAAQINGLCPLDRSVEAALRGIRRLAHTLADPGGDQDGEATWRISPTALDLCDAIRSGQLQRRLSEYVDMKRLQVSHYFIANGLLGHDRDELRSLAWLRQTPAEAGALGLWSPSGQMDRLVVQGVYDRGAASEPAGGSEVAVPVEAFPPAGMLFDTGGLGRLVVITQVSLEDSDWGLLAVGGGKTLQSALVQETFQQWSILMSASLDQEKANADLARTTQELESAYQSEMALIDEVRVSEERYALAAEAAHDGLWDWDIARAKVLYSSNWKALLGYRDTEIGTSPDEWLARIHPDDAVQVREQIDKALDGVEQFIDLEHRLRDSSGEYRWIACSGRSVMDDDGRPIRLVGSITDITVRRLLQEQLLQEARFDGLTGLAKSAPFKDRLNEALALAKGRPDYWCAVLFLDLDGFKAINDTLGHAAGDELLASVARRLEQSLRANDTAARLGGDEFAIILNDVDPVRELPMIIKRIQALICAPHHVGGTTASVGAAIGVAISGGLHTTADDLLHEADTAMYRAKNRNKQSGRATADAVVRLTFD